MKVGAISYCFHREETKAVLQKFQRIGLRNLELWRGHPDGRADYTQQDRQGAEDMAALAAGFGIAPQAYCIGGFGPADSANFRRAFEYAAGLGVGVMTGCATPEIIPALDSLCQEYSIRFSIENHLRNVFETPADFQQTLEASSPWIGVNFDSGHFAASGCHPLEAARALQGRIYHVHLKDIRTLGPERHGTVALGRGEVDIAGLIGVLKQGGYTGHLSIEHEIEGDPSQDLKESLRLVEGLLRG